MNAAGVTSMPPGCVGKTEVAERPVFAAFLERIARREDLTRAEAAEALRAMAEGRASETEMAAFLMGLRVKGETAEEIAGMVETMRKVVVPVRLKSPRALVDIVGTGGDGLGTFNISTTAAFVVAGAGVKVAKHGNRAASSRCGSADVLEALGVRLDLEPEQIAECIDRVGLGFMLAPRHHPATGRVAGVRRSLGIRTVFNFLGPLTNPAGAARLLLGVGVPEFLPVLAGALARLDCERALVVSGQEGMDEISVAGPTTVIEVERGVASRPYVVEPAECGVGLWPLQALAGGDADRNARLTRAVLSGETGAPRDAVLLNAGAALYVAGVSSSIREGVELARETVDNGRAFEVLEKLGTFTRSMAARTAARGSHGRQARRPEGEVAAQASRTSYLDRIVADVRKRLDERKRRIPLSTLQAEVRDGCEVDPRPSFSQVLRSPRVSLIAEVKRRSPSKGLLRPTLDVGRLVEAYAAGGAAAVSVLTEEDHFGGSLDDLKTAVSRVALPVLRKDFIVDPYQIWEARANGASAVLLIASLLSDQDLQQFAETAREVGLDVLLEVHDALELERALSVPEVVIGINNRDLRSFVVSLETTLRLAGRVPEGRLVVAESGIGSWADVQRVAQVGVNAVLVGEALLRGTDPEAAARSLLLPAVPVVGRGVVATVREEG